MQVRLLAVVNEGVGLGLVIIGCLVFLLLWYIFHYRPWVKRMWGDTPTPQRRATDRPPEPFPYDEPYDPDDAHRGDDSA